MTSSDPSEMAAGSTETSPSASAAATVPASPPEEAEPVFILTKEDPGKYRVCRCG